MADHQLEPFENVELGEKQDQLQVFEKAVLEHEGRGSDEDSSSAPLPANYPYKQRMRRSVYEKEKQKLQIELLKVQSWVKDSGQRIVEQGEIRHDVYTNRLIIRCFYKNYQTNRKKSLMCNFM